jgi:hypothetical protein
MAEVRDALGIEGLSAATARNFRDKDRTRPTCSPTATTEGAKQALRALIENIEVRYG